MITNNILLIENNLGNLKNKGVNNSIHILKQYIKNYKISNQKALSNGNLEQQLFNNLINIYNNIDNEKIYIGGDHSTAMATITKNYEPGMKIIWIDAHPDINTYVESETKNFHGMPLAYLTGLDKLNNSCMFTPYIPFKDILYIGIRSIDEFESKIIKEKNIKYIDCKLENYREIINDFLGDSKFHISFDVDSITPYDMPCTGTMVENGIPQCKMRELMDYLLTMGPNSLDIMEINLELGTYYHYRKSIATLFYIFDKYKIFTSVAE